MLVQFGCCLFVYLFAIVFVFSKSSWSRFVLFVVCCQCSCGYLNILILYMFAF